MDPNIGQGPGRSLADGVTEAGEELGRVVQEEILPATEEMEQAFVNAAEALKNELASAARTGTFSIKTLTRTIADEFKTLAVNQLVRAPVQSAVGALFGCTSLWRRPRRRWFCRTGRILSGGRTGTGDLHA